MTSAVHFYRIAAETRQYKAVDLSGAGAAMRPGRWNNAGEFVVYAAENRALAVVETSARINDGGLPQNRFVVCLSIPTAVWKSRTSIKLSQLDPAWSSIPAGNASVAIGSAWYEARSSALLVVPSVIVPEEKVLVINAKHPSSRLITARIERAFEFNRVFRSNGDLI